ncbi:glucose 1-dehydrogenase [Streptomyces sp. NBC_01275]|uniref:SDR family NAD(P)-dependent oxidoreductase n=1 Tax=Streptomyces sp. NBC_01275 TaxID=2903807 RepID=UPI00225B1E7A|nr:glucose 1-dehydrogenase [Streptomyces sp. NBC_01275]MCX4761524.1 glucose 1-dehydrogenase [Streptomyces sp. NBC_01275]
MNARGMLIGKVVMVTGASSGIGADAARLFAAEGAAVVLLARRADMLEVLAKEINSAGGRATAVPGDVIRPEDVRRAVETAVDTYGHLDSAFNNAGWATAGTPLHETADSVFDQIIDTNLRGVWNCLKYEVPAMLESSGGGSIVNTASVAGVVATGTASPYIAAKHAVVGLTRAAADEYGQRGVRVNSLIVGSTRTELMSEVLDRHPELEEPFVARSMQRRMAAPKEVAEAAVWLCSDRSSFVTGTAMAVDGGWTGR